MKTVISKDIEYASVVLKKGGIIVFPTETVWGIGADSRNFSACEKIYQIKKRPKDNPFIIHVSNFEELNKISHLDEKYFHLVKNFSPGPITYILNKKDSTIYSSSLNTIGVRIPSSKEFISILEYSNIPVSAPSANFSGKPSITKLKDAIENFDGFVDFIYEGDDSEIGLESTVLSLYSENPKILRPGKITESELLKFLPDLDKSQDFEVKIISPGTKYRHYSPDCIVEMYDNNDFYSNNEFSYIGFRSMNAKYQIQVENNLEYMKNLYSFFIESDKRKIKIAYCEKPLEDMYQKTLLNRIEKAIQK